MNDALIFILSVIGLLALYWAILGQWKYNKMMKKQDNTVVSAEYIEEKNDSDKAQ